eukprot:2301616-Rhodomonas_salina.1
MMKSLSDCQWHWQRSTVGCCRVAWPVALLHWHSEAPRLSPLSAPAMPGLPVFRLLAAAVPTAGPGAPVRPCQCARRSVAGPGAQPG